MRSRAWPDHQGTEGDRHRVGTVEAQQLRPSWLGGAVERASGGPRSLARSRSWRRPRPQGLAVRSIGGVGHGQQHVEGAGADRGAASSRAPALHHPEGEVADALELAGHAQHRDDEAQVGGHRRLPAQQVVAALGERHVHGVDVVVGGDGLAATRAIAGGQDLAHALEVLVDPHAHELDLEAQLLELGRVGLAHRPGPAVSRIGR